MNYKQGFCASLLCTLVSLQAHADLGNLYGSAKIGGSREHITDIHNTATGLVDVIPTKSSETGTVLAYGGAIGYRFNTFMVPVRIEGDYTYRNHLTYNADPVYAGGIASLKSNVEAQNILGNVYVDIPLLPMFGVFIGGGGGLAFNRTHNKLTTGAVVTKTSTDRNDVSWMGTVGLSVVPINWLALDLSYRYTGLGDVQWTDTTTQLTSTNFTAQEIFLTFRFTLPSRRECCGRKEVIEYKPMPVPEAEPIRRRPQTKSPAYKPHHKGADYEPHAQKGPYYYEPYSKKAKAPAYEEPPKGATYDPNRAKRVKKKSNNG